MSPLAGDSSTSRRRILQLSAAAVAGSVAGCGTVISGPSRAAELSPRWRIPLADWTSDALELAPETVYVEDEAGIVGFDRASGEEVWRDSSVRRAEVDDETLFVKRGEYPNSEVRALDLETHEPRWRMRNGQGIPRVHAGTAYGIVSPYSEPPASGRRLKPGLHALTLHGGTSAWRFTAAGNKRLVGSAGDAVFVWTDGGIDDAEDRFKGLYALDAGTGTERWRKPIDEALETTEVTRELVAFGTQSPRNEPVGVYGFDRETGRTRWVFETDGGAMIPAHHSDELLLVNGLGHAEFHTYALDLQRGDAVWEASDAGSLGFWGGLVTLKGNDGWVAGVDPATGAKRWRVDPRRYGAEPATEFQPWVYGDERSLVLVAGRTMLGVDPATGENRWRFEADRQFARGIRSSSRSIYASTDRTLYRIERP